MPSKIKSERVGSGLTAHTRRRRSYDMTQPLTGEEAAELKSFFRNVGKRDPIEDAKSLAERTLVAIANGNTDPHDFNPRDGMGWYSREIIDRCKWRDLANEKGDSEQAQRLAFEIGVLVTEAQLKSAWDADVEAAVKNAEIRQRVNNQNAKATDAERRSIVVAIRAERNCSILEACKIANQRHPKIGAATTFRDSYYNKS